jgi:hypothetical protein
MAISFKHAFTSPKADGVDSTLVQPSNWNAEHTLTLAAGKVLGRNTSSAGAAQELPLAFDTAGNAALSATGSFTTAVGTTAERPGTPVTGMFRFNSSLVKFEGYDGTTWSPVGGGGATISDTAPASPSAGDLWWNSANGQMYTYYNDGTSSQWVVANSFTGGSAYLPLSGGTLTGALSGTSITLSGTVTDGKGELRDVPQNAQTSAYTLVASDHGKHISITTGGVTVPASVFGVGDTVSIYNNSGSSQTITQGASVTLRQVGTANTGNRTLAQYGLCTILCVASNTFVITGGGLT